jgi:fatty-acyl-CoA synthase
MFHVAGAIIFGLAATNAGVELILPTPLGLRNKAVVGNHWKIVEALRPTMLCGAPTSMTAVQGISPDERDISSALHWITGGTILSPELADRFESLLGIGVREIFGMTETSGVIAITPRLGMRKRGSVGFRLPYCELKIAKLEPGGKVGQAVEVGQSGSVLFRGPNRFDGYLDESHNEGVLLDDGWLMTGDLGRVTPDGYLAITGRAKDLIIRGGHNIDPAMIEEVAYQHPSVLLSAAIGEPDAYAGEVPVLYVTLRPGSFVEPNELMAFLTPRIAERPARPRSILVVPDIPITAVGKVFKPPLRIDAARRAVDTLIARIPSAPASWHTNIAEDSRRGLVAHVLCEGMTNERLTAFRQALSEVVGCFPVPIETESPFGTFDRMTEQRMNGAEASKAKGEI